MADRRRPRKRKKRHALRDEEFGVIGCYPEPNGKFRCKVIGMNTLMICEAISDEDIPPASIVPRERVRLVPRSCGRVILDEGEEQILVEILKEYVRRNAEHYLMIVNYGGMYTRDMHILEFLPGIGRATRKKIEAMRPFSSLDEVKEKLGIDIVEAIAKRIRDEILGRTYEKIYARGSRAGP